jgi:hypothetical protein
VESSPTVLHFSLLLNFRTFPDAWFGGARAIPPSYHLQSRDFITVATSSGDDKFEAARAFYRRTTVLDDAAQCALQVSTSPPPLV